MLGHDRAMHLARVGKNNLAVNKFRKHQLMNSRRGRVNPAQFLGRSDLLWANRPGDNDLSIDDFFIDSLVIGKIDNLDLRKFLLASALRTKPAHSIDRTDDERR